MVENVRAVAPDAEPQHVRAALARLLFRGERAERERVVDPGAPEVGPEDQDSNSA